jgi:AcrR family transcriptional regulator
MPKTHSEKEKQAIVQALREAAAQTLRLYGKKRTTVDDLVKQAKIPKGTFYLFYPSKEMLLFDVILQWHEEIHRELSCMLSELGEKHDPDALTEVLVRAYRRADETGLMDMMLNGDLDILIRKLPADAIDAHIKEDELEFQIFAVAASEMTHEDRKRFTAAFRALFFVAGYRRVIGEEEFPDVMRLLIRGLVLQLPGAPAKQESKGVPSDD